MVSPQRGNTDKRRCWCLQDLHKLMPSDLIRHQKCWQQRRVAGAWGRPRRLGDAAGPAPRPLRALLTGLQGCPHFGLPAQRVARAGEPDGEFRALPKPPPRRRVPASQCCLLNPRLGSLLHIPGTKPPASLRPGGRARPGSAATGSGALSHAHVLTGTQHASREVDSPHPACLTVRTVLSDQNSPASSVRGEGRRGRWSTLPGVWCSALHEEPGGQITQGFAPCVIQHKIQRAFCRFLKTLTTHCRHAGAGPFQFMRNNCAHLFQTLCSKLTCYAEEDPEKFACLDPGAGQRNQKRYINLH
ncbi:uncharacterized protein [Equus asinus]|uniref:uncharacterized protein n=1 Tax=Equus asinus TaxID=9793 RepID=UPI001D03702F|nr:uncharacterized protein LOC123280374 [Equus asinus]